MDGDIVQLRSIIFGFGLGMVFLSAIFLVAYRFENRQQVVVEEPVADIEIEEYIDEEEMYVG